MIRPALIIGNKNYSSWSLRPWIFMTHHAIPFDEIRIPLFTDTTDAQLEPYGSDYKVPVLKHGDLVVWDSLAILEYLSETWLDGKGWPVDPAARAIARAVSTEMHSSFFNLRNEFPMNCRTQFDHVTPSRETGRDIDRIDVLWRNCRQRFGQDGPWLFGEFCIADAMYAPVVLRFHSYKVKLNGISRDYMDTMLGHTGLQAWIEASRQESEIIAEAEVDGN